MRILAIVHKYPPVHNAGAEVMLHAMLVDLARRGHDCTVTYPKAKPEELDGIPIRPTPARDGGLLEAARSADILITHLDVTPRAMRVAAAADRPLVHLIHNDAQLAFHKVDTARAALVVFNSEWIARSYRRWAGPSILVRPPVSTTDYAPIDGPHDRVTLINLTQAKGAPTFYRLAEMAPERLFLGVRGAYGTQVEPRHLGRRRLANVELIAHVPAASMRADVYARTRVLVVPSSYESWGRVAIEASAGGIPVIAHPTDGLQESLGDGGLFAQHAKPGDYLRLLKRLDDPGLYADVADAGLERARHLERLIAGDLDAFALRLEELDAAYARRDRPEESPLSILSTQRAAVGRACPICGARDCACGGDGGVTTVNGTRRGLPVRVYRTGAGHFRLNEDDARRRGYLPDGPTIPLSALKQLRGARINADAHAVAYARANDDAREAYLTAVHAVRPPGLARHADELLEALSAAPAAQEPDDGLDAIIPPEDAPPAGRVGEVLAWAGTDPGRLLKALDAERAAKNPRTSLVAELEQRLEA